MVVPTPSGRVPALTVSLTEKVAYNHQRAWLVAYKDQTRVHQLQYFALYKVQLDIQAAEYISNEQLVVLRWWTTSVR